MPVAATWPEIVGAYPELALKVREVTGEVASRVAARRAGISHDTIIRMWQGDRVSQPILIRFALGYRVDPNPLLEAAGYPPMEDYGFQRQPVPKVEETALQTKTEPEGAPRIERVPVFPIPEGYNDLDDPIVYAAESGAREAAEKAYQSTYKSIADALRLARRIAPGTVMGPAPEDD